MVFAGANHVAVLAAAVAGLVVGFLWYGPLFGKLWMSLAKPPKSAMKKDGMWKTYLLALVSSAVMAYVLNAFLSPGAGLQANFMTTAWLWLGFTATVLFSPVLWMNRPFKLFVLDASHYLVSLLVMATVLGLWP